MLFLFQENNTIKNIIFFNDSRALFLGKAGEKRRQRQVAGVGGGLVVNRNASIHASDLRCFFLSKE